MTNQRLLDRQVALLDYLASANAIFGIDGSAPTCSGLHDFDVGRLRLEAMFSYDKRIGKISAIFAKTWPYLEANRTALLHRFVDACPPASIGRVDNAQQFYDFLCTEWTRDPPEPAYLPDIAAYELACAKVWSHAAEPGTEYDGPRPAVRRHPGAEQLICCHNVVPLFAEPTAATDPIEGTTCLAIAMAAGSEGPRVFELPEPVLSILAKLDDWVPLEVIATVPTARALFRELEEAGLVEVSA